MDNDQGRDSKCHKEQHMEKKKEHVNTTFLQKAAVTIAAKKMMITSVAKSHYLYSSHNSFDTYIISLQYPILRKFFAN